MNNIDTIIITHGIKGFPHHFFSGSDVIQLSHCPCKRTKPTKFLNKQLNGMTRGYFINRKFRSLTWIEKRKYPTVKIILGKEFDDPF